MATQTKERKLILKAINDLKLKVTPSDVASKTGLPLLKVSSELNQIASDTQAHLQVSEQGDIAYQFSGNIQAAYMAKGIQRVFEKVFAKTLAISFFLLRISFGIMLIVSLIIISVLIIFLIIVMSQRGGSNSRDGDLFGGFGGHHGGFHLSFFDYLILRDLIYWGTASTYRARYRLDQPTIRRPDRGNFLFNVFSFLFGDGNPNKNLEERKWAMIAQVIRNSGGSVSAEQLAPYTGAKPGDEDAVLPVLSRFNGVPQVSEKGNIIYTFPNLQVTTQEQELGNLPPYLKEWQWNFSNVPDGGLTPVFILGGINFFGSVFCLYYANVEMSYIDKYGNEILAASPLEPFSGLIVFLLVYATLFLAVPSVRYLIQNGVNKKIEARNQKRKASADKLLNPDDDLLQKLAEAKSMKIDTKYLSEENTIFDTSKDHHEQKYKDDLEKEFDATP